MTVALATPLNQILLAPGSAITVNGLTWQYYELLLAELGSDRATRLAYDTGTLEIRVPSQLHEILNRLLSKIVFALAEELEIEIVDLGSTTWNRSDLDKGIEPDSCFFIQNAQCITGLNPDIPENLPPDLAIEVDIASASDNKVAIYQALEVPELWIYRQGQLKILHLTPTTVSEAEISRAFPQITSQQLQTWIELRETATDITVIKAVRQFCQSRSA